MRTTPRSASHYLQACELQQLPVTDSIPVYQEQGFSTDEVEQAEEEEQVNPLRIPPKMNIQ